MLPHKKIHYSSKIFEWEHYEIENDGSINYEKIQEVF